MSFVFWLFFAAALFYLIPKLRRRWRVLKYVTKIPCGPTLPILGQILWYKGPTEILSGFQQGCTELGPAFRVTAFWKEGVFLSDPAYVELVLGSTKLLHKSEEYDKLDSWLGTGLLTAGPEKWKKTRKIITPTFHFQILEDFVDIFDFCSNTLVTKIKKRVGENSVDVSEYISLCTLDVICETAMGTKVNAQVNSDSKYVSCVKDMSRIIAEQIFSPKRLPLFFYLSGDARREKKNLKVLHDYTESVISSRRKELANQTGQVIDRKKRLAFLDLLIQSSIDGRPMTDNEIRQEVDTFMFEGHDTTSSAINSTLYCLAFHQDVQEKVFEEIKEVFGKDKSKPVTFSDLQNMRYLEMVIKETLRLYPPVPIFARVAHEDTEMGDLIIPKGVDFTVFTWGLHRNPAVYPDPESFDPERFTLDNQNLRNPFSYVPFSAGQRNCIGQRFAMLEVKSVVSKLLRNFEILPVRDFQPLWVPDAVLKTVNGMHVRFEDRPL